jgi:hypothetical protein
MVPEASLDISRRQFLAVGGLTVAAACFAPSYLMAETEGIVVGAFKEAATAKVTVQNLRRNISVLLGPGGNIAVLTGPDGKLLVDAEIGGTPTRVRHNDHALTPTLPEYSGAQRRECTPMITQTSVLLSKSYRALAARRSSLMPSWPR